MWHDGKMGGKQDGKKRQLLVDENISFLSLSPRVRSASQHGSIDCTAGD